MEDVELEPQWPVLSKLAKVAGLVICVLALVAFLQLAFKYQSRPGKWIPSVARTAAGYPGFVAGEHTSPPLVKFTLIDTDAVGDHVAIEKPVRPDWQRIANFNVVGSPDYAGPTESEYPFGFRSNIPAELWGVSDSTGGPDESDCMSPCFRVVIRNDGDKPCMCTGVGVLVVARHLIKVSRTSTHRAIEAEGFDGITIDGNPSVGAWKLQKFRSAVEIASGNVLGQKLQLRYWRSWDPSVIQLIFEINGMRVLSPEIFIGDP